jgi:hypothetical protein
VRVRPVACERSRAYVSLRLDLELAELEDRILSAHLAQCSGCRSYESDVVGFTRALRAAPPVPTGRQIAVPRRPRPALTRPLPHVAAAAAAVLALVGAGSIAQDFGADRPLTSTTLPPRPHAAHDGGPRTFATDRALEREQVMISFSRPGAPLVQLPL